MRISVLLALLLSAAPGQIRAQCVPSPAVQKGIDDLPIQTPEETSWAFRQKYQAAIQALRTRVTDDVFIERTYLDAMWRRTDKDKVIAEFKARYEKAPDNALVTYLYGIAIEGRQTPESVKLFEAALAKSPQFAWPHLELAGIYGMPVFLDKDKVLTHTKAFLSACPDALDGYQPLTSIDDKAVLTPYAAKLRAMLQPRTDKQAIIAYKTLWAIEFKGHPGSEYEGLRKQVADDLKRLRALDLTTQRDWYYTLEEGYKLANDQKRADWANDERQQRLPQRWELASMDKWQKDHPRPNKDDPADKKRAYYADLLKQTDLWAKERPRMPSVWESRLSAMEYLDDIPAAEVQSTADTFLKFAMDDAGPEGPDASDYFTVARVLYRKHLQPERVVELIEKDLAKLKMESAEPFYDAYATPDNLQRYSFYKAQNPINPTGYEAATYIAMKDAAKARLALTRMEDQLEALKALTGDKADFKKAYTTRLAFWWELKGRLAELEGHDQDAMAFYEHALLSRFESKEPPETGLKDEMADNARRMWAKLGGTMDAWQQWYGRPADALATQATLTWEDANLPLPAFEITDLKGKTWTQASLKGKVTFLNFWASW